MIRGCVLQEIASLSPENTKFFPLYSAMVISPLAAVCLVCNVFEIYQFSLYNIID